ncbi:MAG TPA: serine/threonine-protein kinase [Planctomycetota bacterium]|nr:serine/threonine-protein kinase [Planctomycetota bacterium]
MPAASKQRVPAGAVLLGRYEILALVGAGGMGEVYRAIDRDLQREVAIKLIRSDALDDVRIVRFLNEARVMAALVHPCCIRVHDVAKYEDGSPFLVMELLAGETLWDVAQREPLSPRGAALLLHPVAGALDAVHEEGMCHRDVKPSNILVTRAGVKLADFGLAQDEGAPTRITLQGARLGTVAFMAPEQTRGVEADARTDIYGLGATLYYVVAGRPPFVAEGDSLIQQVRTEEPRPLRKIDRSTPRPFDEIVLRCLAKDPKDRYPTAHALEEDLQRFLAGVKLDGKTSWWGKSSG